MRIEDVVQTLTVRINGALISQICLDFIVYTPGNFFEKPTNTGVLDFYDQIATLFGPCWKWMETDSTHGPRRVDQRALALFPTWFSSQAKTRESYVLCLRNGEKEDDVATTAFECGSFGSNDLPGFLRLSVPVDYFGSNPNAYVDLCCQLIRRLPFLSGRAGYSLRWNEYGIRHHRKGLQPAKLIADWYRGIDLPDDSMIILDEHVRHQIPSINWLTFLSPTFVQKIGGAGSLRSQLPPPVLLRDLPFGWMIQAGPEPQTGNSSNAADLQPYGMVSRALKPLRMSQYPSVVEHSTQWLARFDELPKTLPATGSWRP